MAALLLVAGAGCSSGGGSGQGSTPPGLAATPAAAIDQDGDPGTPCAMTYRADGQTTVVTFQLKQAGELITHLSDATGNQARHDDTVQAGTRTYVDQIQLSQVNDADAILQDPDGTRHVCSIAPHH